MGSGPGRTGGARGEPGSGGIAATRRLAGLIVASGAFIASGIIGGLDTLGYGVFLIALALFLRAYAALSMGVLARARVRGSWKLEGGIIKASFNVCNSTWVPVVWLEVSLSYPQHLRLHEGSRGGLALLPSKGCLRYEASFKARVGEHLVGPVRYVVRDPLGLYRGGEGVLGEPLRVRVPPLEVERVTRWVYYAARSTGLTRARRPGEGVEFYSVRDYRPGDELRRIHWRSMAKGRIAVKEMERESTLYTLFVLLLTPEMFHGPFAKTPFDHVARVIASVAAYASRRGDNVGLLSAGATISHTGGLRPGRRGLVEVLGALSRIRFMEEGRAGPPRPETVARAIVGMVPRERVYVVFIVPPHEKAVDLVRTLAGGMLPRRFVANAFIPVPSLYEAEALKGIERTVFTVKTFQEYKRAREASTSLTRQGIPAVVVTPRQMAEAIVVKMESIRAS